MREADPSGVWRRCKVLDKEGSAVGSAAAGAEAEDGWVKSGGRMGEWLNGSECGEEATPATAACAIWEEEWDCGRSQSEEKGGERGPAWPRVSTPSHASTWHSRRMRAVGRGRERGGERDGHDDTHSCPGRRPSRARARVKDVDVKHLPESNRPASSHSPTHPFTRTQHSPSPALHMYYSTRGGSVRGRSPSHGPARCPWPGWITMATRWCLHHTSYTTPQLESDGSSGIGPPTSPYGDRWHCFNKASRRGNIVCHL
ncbi:hypothetical protein EJ04DRAFT_549020 [Polyplosphaeria fusca]|uniref:Uncharacterized protein n=1 Tax=Polyplosphaeria fusca TaxID=682080 RepID=A0A9P4V7N3_9PLEO|nr:hypothetical protein EJ04DRAFT_549020 [Polyplosphaeria fusca]